jgi:tRNA (guanine37-N1)-methyltransferase
MTLAVKVPKKIAQQVKQKLIETKQINHDFRAKKDNDHIYFAVKKKVEGLETTDIELAPSFEKPITFKEALQHILSPKELEEANFAHEVVGDIAIIEIPETLIVKEQQIATALLKSNKHIKTVVKKDSIHDGNFRTQQHKVLAGLDTTVAEYKENNCTLEFDINEVYFSTRLATERKRVYEQVKEGENVLVMFSGAAPYCCVIGKNTKAKQIIGIEINPQGHLAGLKNIKKNKLSQVKLINGDVKKEVPKIKDSYDRIIMPLPKTSLDFLPEALQVSKKGTIVHLYAFSHEDATQEVIDSIREIANENNHTIELITSVKTTQSAPRTYRMCFDIKVLIRSKGDTYSLVTSVNHKR